VLQSSSACRVGCARPPRPCDARALLGKRVAGFDLAALKAGELLARHVQLDAAELRELVRRLQEWLAAEA